jgi:hypothetical protein
MLALERKQTVTIRQDHGSFSPKGSPKFYAMRYRVIDTARRVGETAGTRRFDVQLAGALQMPLKRRATSEIGPVSAKAERAFRFSGAA